MIPSQIVCTKKIPSTHNGKIDFNTIKNIFLEQTEVRVELSENEIILLDIWKKSISKENFINPINSDVTYFDVGGQSLHIIELKNDLDSYYEINIPLQDLMNNITLRTMCEYLSLLDEDNIDIMNNNTVDFDILDYEIKSLHEIFDDIGVEYDKNFNINKSNFLDGEYVESFKNKSISRNAVEGSEVLCEVILDSYDPLTYTRSTTRVFDKKKPVSYNDFVNLISVLLQEDSKYLYPSAGGLYPIDIYIQVRKDRVLEISEGIYYLNPYRKVLSKISENNIDSDVHYFTNSKIYQTSSFSIYLVFNSHSIMPKYGGMSYSYAIMESGVISQVLSDRANHLNIGSCIIGEINEKKVSQSLRLKPENKYLLNIEFGTMPEKKDECCVGELVKLRNGTTDKNIVFIHAGSGEINIYLNLSEQIDEQYNIYAIKHLHNTNNIAPSEYSFSKLAIQYNELLKHFDTIDLIGGWCIGGAIANEISLLNCDKYKRVLMINAMPPQDKNITNESFDIKSELEFINQFKVINFKNKDFINSEELWCSIASELEKNIILRKLFIKVIPKELYRLIPTPDRLNVKELIYYINHFRSSDLSRRYYMLKSVNICPTIYLAAEDELIEGYKNWEKFNPDILFDSICGDHVTIFNVNNVSKWIGKLNEQLKCK